MLNSTSFDIPLPPSLEATLGAKPFPLSHPCVSACFNSLVLHCRSLAVVVRRVPLVSFSTLTYPGTQPTSLPRPPAYQTRLPDFPPSTSYFILSLIAKSTPFFSQHIENSRGVFFSPAALGGISCHSKPDTLQVRPRSRTVTKNPKPKRSPCLASTTSRRRTPKPPPNRRKPPTRVTRRTDRPPVPRVPTTSPARRWATTNNHHQGTRDSTARHPPAPTTASPRVATTKIGDHLGRVALRVFSRQPPVVVAWISCSKEKGYERPDKCGRE